ncbi:MAG TPA: HDOD domain-containing protein [Rubrivivax sp.]|nr:HDOD domain-containing protein [Rubrivivax sp.]
MGNWFTRWLPRGLFGGRAQPPKPVRAKAGRAASASAVQSVQGVQGVQPAPAASAGALADSASLTPAAGYGQRLALVDKSGRLAGFELRWPAAMERRLAGRHEEATAQAAALVAAARLAAGDGRRALVELDAALLAHAAVAAQAGPGVMLAWSGALPPPAAVVLALRERGALVGAPDGPPERLAAAEPALARPDFVLLRAAAGGVDTLQLSAQRWREALPRVPLVACGASGIDDVERLLRSGFAYAGGRLDARRAAYAPRSLDAAAHRICELMNHLALDRDTAVIAEAVRADVALSYRLLRYANSPAIGLKRGVDSVEQAVLLLGRAELQRWLAVLLLGAASARPAAAALQEHALARGRLFEGLARRAGEPRPQALFTLGLLSQLDVLLQLPMAVALEPLRLPDAAREALLHRRGSWAGYLAVADALEGDDQAVLDHASAPFGGAAAVLAEAESAWGWAAQLLQADRRA